MLEQFICPDGATVDIDRCLDRCRLENSLECGRCISQRFLRMMAGRRRWSGKPTVTQLLNGTREEYLKITQGFAVDPQALIPAFFGSAFHNLLENSSDERFIRERRLVDPTNSYSGQFDCYDTEEQILYDTKTYGSFKAAQVLGIEKIRVPVVDDVTGEPVLTKTGRVKHANCFVNGVRLKRDATLQLNAYRLMLEFRGCPVKEMRLEVFVRDGGTWIANDRGVDRNSFLVKINRVDDHRLQSFLLEKASRLRDALDKNKMPPPCRPVETWGGLKCKSFCNVRQFCERGASK